MQMWGIRAIRHEFNPFDPDLATGLPRVGNRLAGVRDLRVKWGQ